MLKLTNLPTPSRAIEQSIRINRHTKAVSVQGVVIRFRDKDTLQFIMYIPSLEISAYGETQEKAQEMFKFSLDDYFKYLTDMSRDDMETELRRLGFKQKMFSNKVFSKSFIDGDGTLHSVNAVEGKVELLSLEA
jgi:hypothetical protein